MQEKIMIQLETTSLMNMFESRLMRITLTDQNGMCDEIMRLH
jgi:hypothetical protein